MAVPTRFASDSDGPPLPSMDEQGDAGGALALGDRLIDGLAAAWSQVKADVARARDEADVLRQESRLLRIQLEAAVSERCGGRRTAEEVASRAPYRVHREWEAKRGHELEDRKTGAECVSGYFDVSSDKPPTLAQVQMVEVLVRTDQGEVKDADEPKQRQDIWAPATTNGVHDSTDDVQKKLSDSATSSGRYESDGHDERHESGSNYEGRGNRRRLTPQNISEQDVEIGPMSSKYSESHSLRELFDGIDRGAVGIISPADAQWLCGRLKNKANKAPSVTKDYWHEVMLNFNNALELQGICSCADPAAGLNFEAFKILMKEEHLELLIGIEIAELVDPLRRMFAQRNTEKMVQNLVGVSSELDSDGNQPVRKREVVLEKLEPLIGLMIIVNAFLLGVSSDHDPDWPGWQVLEYIFTTIFTLELLLKFWALGARDFLFGEHKVWNIFDTVVVSFAIMDVIVSITRDMTEDNRLQAQQVRILRIARLVRLTRVVRVLQFRIFKDLQLMLQGVLFGLRTLFWAIILLFFVIYCVGLLIRNYVGLEHLDDLICVNDPELGVVSGAQACGAGLECRPCSPSEMQLVRYKGQLFSSVPHVMITIFRCFTDGCTSVDGSPLLVLMWDVYGFPFLIGYCLCVCFVIFGLFNLIMAIFVENTMEAAKAHRAKRIHMSEENFKVARQLHWLVRKFSGAATHELLDEGVARAPLESATRSFFKWMKEKRKGMLPDWARSGTTNLDGLDFGAGHMEVTRENFNALIGDRRVKKILDDLDVNPSARDGLFDVLDADGNGTLEAMELVRGILKLRGTPDKSDSIAALLGVRALQQSLKSLESKVSRNQSRLEHLIKNNASGEPLSPKTPGTVRRKTRPSWAIAGDTGSNGGGR